MPIQSSLMFANCRFWCLFFMSQEACASVREHRLSDEYELVKMQLYGLYKIATEGKCDEPKPQDMVRQQEAGRPA